jgi:hypothetical protein
MTGDFAQRSPGITLLGNHLDGSGQQFSAFFQAIAYRASSAWGVCGITVNGLLTIRGRRLGIMHERK